MESKAKLAPRQAALIGAMILFAIMLAVLLWEFESTDYWLFVVGSAGFGLAFLYVFYQYNVEFVVRNRTKKEQVEK
ncbi:MAG: hypothetical protein M1587_07220 [Thaumarchaeota archaeon]|nr:hypothetical protein [Nitrososphaerota archaeon]